MATMGAPKNAHHNIMTAVVLQVGGQYKPAAAIQLSFNMEYLQSQRLV